MLRNKQQMTFYLAPRVRQTGLDQHGGLLQERTGSGPTMAEVSFTPPMLELTPRYLARKVAALGFFQIVKLH